MFLSLAENDITKVKIILGLPLVETMNFLSYRIERDEVIDWRRKQKKKRLG